MRTPILTLALTLTALGAWAAPAAAQGPGHRAPDPEARLERLQERLDLTDAQAEQVAAIFADATEQRQAIWSEAAERREATRERMEAVHESTRGRLSEVLSEEQMETLDRMRANAKRGRDRPRGRRPGGRRG